MTAAYVTTLEDLTSRYAAPSERALLKQIPALDAHCRAFIAASPFVVLGTSGRGGGDCSPRGDEPGFVRVVDDRHLLLPDRRGNNRIDSLRNILDDPRVAMLFLVPGVDETLRVNGRAALRVDAGLLESFAVGGKVPACVVEVEIDEVFLQCARALVRSGLWDPERFVDRSTLPSMGTILAAHTGGRVDAASYDQSSAETLPLSLY